MNIKLQVGSSLLFGQRSSALNGGLKSTQQKMERQAKCENQVAFYEEKKSNLKNMECSSLEEIAEKLDMLHTYDDQIAAAKAEYNREQMSHALDEALEKGEKIAKAVEKTKPKTPEERAEELAKEALGIEEEEGMLKETLEKVSEVLEETVEVSEALEESTEALEDQAAQDADVLAQQTEEVRKGQETEGVEKEIEQRYRRFDMRA
ncbi:MAG: hypothetical protein K2H52_00515 [Lachnospiraceae bacterium]|nr:hypothetical protein [Lachnospiraceae bacterium]MDE7285890.1 hypothetical protein [Lachnospiraceae bacterium]